MDARRFYCTLADRNYLVRALALIESLQRHEQRDWVLYFVCLDELTRAVLGALALPNVVLVPLHALEKGDQPLLATRGQRSLVEYYWTMTPTLILRLLEHDPQIDVLTYLDADLYFYSSPDPIYDELGQQSVLIDEHRFTPELQHLQPENGRFNVGLLCFRRDERGLTALRWWRERCLEWCFNRSENGKMGDQMYLDDWPQRFPGLVVLQHPGAGLAPWNHSKYQIDLDHAGTPTVDGLPAVFFHFQSLQVPHPALIVAAKHTDYPMSEAILRACYLPYAQALGRQARAVREVLPTFAFGLAEPARLTPNHTLLVHSEAPAIDPGPAPLRRIELPDGWTAYNGVQDDLLFALRGRSMQRAIEVLYLVGGERLHQTALFFQLFPALKHLCVFQPGTAPVDTSDPRVRVFQQPLASAPAQGIPGPDLLVLDAGGDWSSLQDLPAGLRRSLRLVYGRAQIEGAQPLAGLEAALQPELALLAFAPLDAHAPGDGNALFVNRDMVDLMRGPR